MKPTLKNVCKVHSPDYRDEASKVSHNQANVCNVNSITHLKVKVKLITLLSDVNHTSRLYDGGVLKTVKK